MTHVRKAIDGAAWEEAHIGTFAGCAGPCDQGRKLCPCPDACNVAHEIPDAWAEIWFWGVVVAGISVLIAFAAWLVS
jgi:hypothetical protein